MSNVIIVSRHPAAVEFIREAANLPKDTLVFESVTAKDVLGHIVYGNLPMHLACVARCVIAVEFIGDPPRGQEYTIEDMLKAWPRLVVYTVSSLTHAVDLGSDPVVTVYDDDKPAFEIFADGSYFDTSDCVMYNCGDQTVTHLSVVDYRWVVYAYPSLDDRNGAVIALCHDGSIAYMVLGDRMVLGEPYMYLTLDALYSDVSDLLTSSSAKVVLEKAKELLAC